jgi:hypothetical protein
MKRRAFVDAWVVAGDVADVVRCFSTVPPELIAIGEDAYSAVVHGDMGLLTELVPRIEALATGVQADIYNAGPAIDALRAGVIQLIADLQG